MNKLDELDVIDEIDLNERQNIGLEALAMREAGYSDRAIAKHFGLCSTMGWILVNRGKTVRKIIDNGLLGMSGMSAGYIINALHDRSREEIIDDIKNFRCDYLGKKSIEYLSKAWDFELPQKGKCEGKTEVRYAEYLRDRGYKVERLK